MTCVNNKTIIPIIAGIIIVAGITIVAIGSNSEPTDIDDATDKKVEPIKNITQNKLDEINKTKSNNEYTPKEREWITSGPFQIDRSQYVLGEKVFLRIGGLGFEERGEVAFLRPLNDTHYSVYLTIPFDGANKPAFNYYMEPDLSKIRKLCTIDDLVGDWRVVFRGTDYPNLEFTVTEEILPGDEKHYEPVC